MIAGIEIGDAHRAERDARRRQVIGIGALPVALEMGTREYDRGGIGGRRAASGRASLPRSRRRTAVRCRAFAPERDRRAAQPQSLPETRRRAAQRAEAANRRRFYSRMVLPSPQMLKLCATLALVSTLGGRAGRRHAAGPVVLTDVSGVATPVPRLVLLVSDDPPTAEPRRVRTTADGTVELKVAPGTYIVELDERSHSAAKPTPGRRLSRCAPDGTVLDLTADNAESADSARLSADSATLLHRLARQRRRILARPTAMPRVSWLTPPAASSRPATSQSAMQPQSKFN